MKRIFLTLLAALTAITASAAEKRPPNFIVLLIDDMGWGDFSCFGNKEAQTPNIDQLAAEGIRFKQFYVNSPICSPSRCALTTGRYPQHWKITSFLENRASNQRRGMAQWLDPKAPTLARCLKQAGYATGHFGKWHLGGQRDVNDAPSISSYGFDQSLTNFEGMGPKLLPLAIAPGDAKPHKIWAEAVNLGGPVTWMERSKITTGYIDAAIPFIDAASNKKQPFYINLWPDDVHSPFWPPVDQWADGKRGLYHAVLKEMDRQFGKLFQHIRENPDLRDNTIVLVCSDNGPEPGAGSAGPFRGSKGMLLEGGIRSPLIVWAPGMTTKGKAGSTDDTSILAAIDLVPSILRLAGVSIPADIRFDGEDHSTALLGNQPATRKSPIFWRRPPDRKMAGEPPTPQADLAVRDGKWKLLCDYDGGSPQLFNLEADPRESNNLSESQPEVTRRLVQVVTTWHQSLPADKGPELGAKAAGRKSGNSE